MPVYFRMSKFVSFQRQLNLYGFNRITKGQDKGGKCDKNFVVVEAILQALTQRARPCLCGRLLSRAFSAGKENSL